MEATEFLRKHGIHPDSEMARDVKALLKKSSKTYEQAVEEFHNRMQEGSDEVRFLDGVIWCGITDLNDFKNASETPKNP